MDKKAKEIAEGLVIMIGKGKPEMEYEDESGEECTCKNCPMHGKEEESD